MNTSIDFIGDIHGHCDELKALLAKLGYVESAGAFRYPGNARSVVFLGDYIDRGNQVRETINLVRAMRDAGSAIPLMGNHEFNALSFWQENNPGSPYYLKRYAHGYLRDHSFNKVAIHSKTVASYIGRREEFEEMLSFLKTLPLYLDTADFRAQHACYDKSCAEKLKSAGVGCFADGPFDELIARANDEDNELGNSLFPAVDSFLKGPEMPLPPDQFFKDSENVIRRRVRLRWWKDPSQATLQELSFQPGNDVPEGIVPENIRKRDFYREDEVPVFFGHYWLMGTPSLVRQNVCCLDYSVAGYRGNGSLVSYRFDGERVLDESKFVWVKSNSNC